MTLERGELIVMRKKGKVQLQVRFKGTLFNAAQVEVSRSVLDRLDELNGKEVEFERIGGQPKQIREVGGRFVSSGMAFNAGQRGDAGRGRGGGIRGEPAAPRGEGQRGTLGPDRRGGGGEQWQPGPRPGAQQSPPPPRPDFHNPYNFIPAPPRNTADPDLGDHRPISQDSFAPDRYTGSIRVRMVTETPLLVPDTENVREGAERHKIYQLRVGADETPLIPASSVRGMLRSAYETVTNSRFGRFSRAQHGDRLAFRMDARDGLMLVPARVENGEIRLLTGTSGVGADGRPKAQDPMYAAWLPRYWDGKVSRYAERYADGSLPQHGDGVVCWIELMRHVNPNFGFWRVREIRRGTDINLLGKQPIASAPHGKSSPSSPSQMMKVRGWVGVTNANINRKHDERVFFLAPDAPVPPGPFAVGDRERAMWRELIDNYQAFHEDKVRTRRERGQQPDQYLGPEPGQTAWSRHVYTPGANRLQDGTLCYVRLKAEKGKRAVDALFPVMISRELYPAAPWSLLDSSLRPAGTIDQLSPADRVFGWVDVDADTREGKQGQNKPTAVRGLLRVGPVGCASSVADAVETFPEDGVPLAILSTPKPQQGRFYAAQSSRGEAQTDGLSKVDAGYMPGKGVRGRKVYPHHANLPGGYWNNPTEDRTRNAGNAPHYQEYRRPDKDGQPQRDDQNRSVRGWVKPGAQFTFDLHVFNLSKVELGALVWLLTLPEGHFLRFGGGRPLGFGSVRLSIDSCDVRTGHELRTRYASWLDTSAPLDSRDGAVQAFKDALDRAYPLPEAQALDDIAFIKAFLVTCQGFEDRLPIHYPRATDTGQPGPPSPDGESFRWFVANEQDARLALRDLWADQGFPTLRRR